MKNTLYSKFKEISLLLAGALVGVSFTPFGDKISQNFLWIIIVIFTLLLFGIGGIEFIYGIWIWLNRKINNFRKIICVYAPYEIDSDTSSWIDMSLRQIKQKLEGSKIQHRIIRSENKIEKYPFVINPYGGVYPEADISSLKSLDAIFEYVKNGGVYINIADIPFYYAYDISLQRRVDTTPLAGDFLPVRSFLQTMLTKKLHCFVYGLTNGADFDEGTERIISLSGNSKNFFSKEIKVSDNNKESFTPVLSIPYGKGYFVFSTFHLQDDDKLTDLITKTKTL